MSTSQGPGGTRNFDGPSHFERITRLRAARRDIDRIATWLRVAAMAFLLGFLLAVILWLIR